MLLALSLTGLVAIGGTLLTRTDLVAFATVLTAVVILAMNTLFYYVQSKRRADFIPFYPDTGIAIFFSMTALNALLLFFRFHRVYGNNPYTLGIYFPVPLPEAFILRALVIVAFANLLFILAFYSQFGATVVSWIPDPPTTSETEKLFAKRALIPLLVLGITLYLLGQAFSGALSVVARNLIYTVLPLVFVVGVYERGLLDWPTVVALVTIAILLLSGHLSFIIVPALGLMACYHFLYRRLKLLHIVQFGTVFVAIAIFGKQYRLRPMLPLFERIQVSLFRMIGNFPSMFARNVIARLSAFESFVTTMYFVDTGKVDLLLGRRYPAFIGKLLPQIILDGDTYFNGGYYTNVLIENNVTPDIARLMTEDTTASLGALGSWYLNFHLAGIVVGAVVMGVVFRVWTQLLEDHTRNIWVVAFHASNIWFMYGLWAFNTRTTRSILLHVVFFVFVFYTIRYSSRYIVSYRAAVAN